MLTLEIVNVHNSYLLMNVIVNVNVIECTCNAYMLKVESVL